MIIFQPERYLLKKQIKEAAVFVGGIVLDIGAGKHHRYEKLFQSEKYITLDVSEKLKPDLVGTADKIPLGDSSVDTIICTQVLGDVRRPLKALAEFHRVLKPKGTVLLSESLLNEIHDAPHDFWRFTNYGLRELFKQADFEIIKMSQRGGFFSALAQLKIRFLIDILNLYKHKFWGRVANWLFIVLGKISIFLDRVFGGRVSQRFALGFLIVAQKK